MPSLTKEEMALIRERIIVTIKRNGELTASGHRMPYSDFHSALERDEIIASNKKLSNADFSVKSIISYFAGRNDMDILFRHDPPKHWIQFALKRVIKQAEIENAARKTISEIKKKNGVGPNEPYHIPAKVLAAELSRTIPFFELYLDKNKMTLQDFVKDLGLNKPETGSSEIGETKGKAQKKPGKESADTKEKQSGKVGKDEDTTWVKVPIRGKENGEPLVTDKANEKVVGKAICDIITSRGTLRNGSPQIVMSKLCVELIRMNSVEFNAIRNRFKGTTRDLLLKKFGKILIVDFNEGEEWVRLSKPVSKDTERNTTDDEDDTEQLLKGEIDIDTVSDAENSEKPSEISADEADKAVREDILRIISQEGTEADGCRQIILGMLCNELAANSDAYQISRGRYKGPARSYLLDRFGDILVIEYLDGKDWVRIPLSVLSGKGTEQKAEDPEGNSVEETPPDEEEKPKTVKTTGKRKEKATELLIQEMINLGDDELEHLLFVMQLVYCASGDIIIKPLKKGEESVVEKKGTTSITAVAERVGLEAQGVLAKNSVISKITAYLTTGEIIGIINEEIKMRKGGFDESPIPNQSEKPPYEVKSNYPYSQAIMIDTDYEGLDEWLPF